MKCIKSIKPTKNTEVGQIVRINDIEAESKVKTGYWAYVAKSEWKESTRKAEPSRNQVGTKSEPSEDPIEKKPYKKGQKPEKKSK